MDNKDKTFEEICYDFQKQIVDIFNNENYIPFLLKYYLMKDIWTNIEKFKLDIDMRVRNSEAQTSEIKLSTADLETVAEEKK